MTVTKREKRRIVVVGGGITGLTAAFYLQREAKKHNLLIEIILIEASFRLGGKIQTLRKDGFIIEQGPESFFDQSGSVRKLAADLNIENDMVRHNNGQTYVAVGAELYPIPSGILLGRAPEVSSFITSGIISLTGKMRAIGDLVLPKTAEKDDEPIGDFFRRRFGKEVVENLVEPLLAGTFAGDIDHLSIRAMFPEFFELEQQHRSLLLGFKKNGKKLYPNIIGEKAYYETFHNGLETLVEALEEQLAETTILRGMRVERVEKNSDETLTVHINNGKPIEGDALIMTTPFNVAKEAFKEAEFMEELPNMNYASIATVTMAFTHEQIKKYKEAMSFYVSRNSDYVITTCTWSNRKWDNVAPDGYDLLRVYIGRVGDEAIVELSDCEIEKTVLQDLSRILGIEDKPLFTTVTRWKQGMPQYTVGHDERLQKMQDDIMTNYPNVQLAGSSYDGISVPDCVAQGKQAAEKIMTHLFAPTNAQ